MASVLLSKLLMSSFYSQSLLHQRSIRALSIKHINKLLIANRGEIACRIMKTAKQMGVKTVAVYSEPDSNAMHVAMADEAYCIGPAASQESYLLGDKLIDIAKTTGCQSIHPGYGFLSESLEFAELCQNSGVIFVGPPPNAIRDMGIKSTSKSIMAAAGVPIIQGYHGDDQTFDTLKAEADKIGYPLMIKAVRGGGGKGMRIALKADEFHSQLESAKRESLKAFGNDAVLLESYVQRPRHVEVQIFADQHGNCVYLSERDCSVQRRHQKIIEEAPAPGISDELRKELGEAAVAAARAVNYRGAGTVEFILDCNTLKFHFMEMNTRLQVEHPVTEMITGTDLVEWQLKVAAGEKLPLSQDQISIKGHAFESRIYAEDPSNNFMPGAGRLGFLATPTPSTDVRVETGVRQGDEVSIHYDPMIAKLVVWGENRKQALDKMHYRLAEYNIGGLHTNVNFLMKLCRHRYFEDGIVHTGFLGEHEQTLFQKEEPSCGILSKIALAMILRDAHQEAFAFRVNHSLERKLRFNVGDKEHTVKVVCAPDGFVLNVNGELISAKGQLVDSNDGTHLTSRLNGCTETCRVFLDRKSILVFTKNGSFEAQLREPDFMEKLGISKNEATDAPVSPMPGVVDKVFVNVGDVVAAGDALMVVIAMKMEHVIKAPKSGKIESILFKAGQNVAKNVPLVKLFNEE